MALARQTQKTQLERFAVAQKGAQVPAALDVPVSDLFTAVAEGMM